MDMIGKHPNPLRIWVCTDCAHSFIDKEVFDAAESGWGHPCKHHPCRKGQVCESYLTALIPETPPNWRDGE